MYVDKSHAFSIKTAAIIYGTIVTINAIGLKKKTKIKKNHRKSVMANFPKLFLTKNWSVSLTFAILFIMNVISGYFYQNFWFGQFIVLSLAFVPFWLYYPIKMIKEIRQRSGQSSPKSQFLIAKLKSKWLIIKHSFF